jgi:serine/threonine protein kinase
LSRRAHQWFVQIADALKYLLNEEIVHFDIKPQNILFLKSSTNKSHCVFKLTDFGIVEKKQALKTQILKEGERLSMKAQEVREGHLNIRLDLKKSHLYSLGITLTHSLTGDTLPSGSDQPFHWVLDAARNWNRIFGRTQTISPVPPFIALLEVARNWNPIVQQTYGMSRNLAQLLSDMTQNDPKLRTNKQVCSYSWFKQKI